MRPTKNNLVTTIPYFSKEYKVEVQVKPISFSSSHLTNIIHFSTDVRNSIGYYICAISVSTHRWVIYSNGRGIGSNIQPQPKNIAKVNEWMNITISQLRELNGYNYSVMFDDILIHSEWSSYPEEFYNVKVYASSDEDTAFNGYVRMLSCYVIDVDAPGSYALSYNLSVRRDWLGNGFMFLVN